MLSFYLNGRLQYTIFFYSIYIRLKTSSVKNSKIKVNILKTHEEQKVKSLTTSC